MRAMTNLAATTSTEARRLPSSSCPRLPPLTTNLWSGLACAVSMGATTTQTAATLMPVRGFCLETSLETSEGGGWGVGL
jgi:hypothetical protein